MSDINQLNLISCSLQAICHQIKFCVQYLNHVRFLKYKDKINYELLRNVFKDVLKENQSRKLLTDSENESLQAFLSVSAKP